MHPRFPRAQVRIADADRLVGHLYFTHIQERLSRFRPPAYVYVINAAGSVNALGFAITP